MAGYFAALFSLCLRRAFACCVLRLCLLLLLGLCLGTLCRCPWCRVRVSTFPAWPVYLNAFPVTLVSSSCVYFSCLLCVLERGSSADECAMRSARARWFILLALLVAVQAGAALRLWSCHAACATGAAITSLVDIVLCACYNRKGATITSLVDNRAMRMRYVPAVCLAAAVIVLPNAPSLVPCS